jgi:hypothetical protein
MRAHGHTAVWGTHTSIGRGTDAKSWSPRLRDWWAAHTGTRRQARPATLEACWDARHEVVRPLRGDTAPEMAVARAGLSVATLLYGLSQ